MTPFLIAIIAWLYVSGGVTMALVTAEALRELRYPMPAIPKAVLLVALWPVIGPFLTLRVLNGGRS